MLPQLVRTLGTEWLLFRLQYEARVRAGSFRRRIPASSWEDASLSEFLVKPELGDATAYVEYRKHNAPRFFFSFSNRADFAGKLQLFDASSSAVRLADEIASGSLDFFHNTTLETGFPPDWHKNPFTGQRAPEDVHWSDIREFDHGDIKTIWEPSRFGFAFTFVRAYWRTGDDRYAELFWQAFEDWCCKNPPQLGPNWKCGQEVSFRVMAWCFALYGLVDSRTSTPERVAQLGRAVFLSGRRIEANLAYALSQHNNHGISEAVGLYTIGILFPEFADSERWRTGGRQTLEAQALELIYEDGSFAQHSTNYHRLILHALLWASRLADLNEEPLSGAVRQRITTASEYLYQIQDQVSGKVPCYGYNDGSLILPLTNCCYQDFRPVVQTAGYYGDGARRFDRGAWDEELMWLFGPEAIEVSRAERSRTDLIGEAGGYYTLRSDNGFAFTRCAKFRHRPAHADLVHLDLWWKGVNVACDAGTYSYNGTTSWDATLAGTSVHNTVTVDGLDQMNRVGRFMWLPWVSGAVPVRKRSSDGFLAYLECAHNGYERLDAPVMHRRGIARIHDDCWLVVDRITSGKLHRYRLHWLLEDFEHEWDPRRAQLTLGTQAGNYVLAIASESRSCDVSVVRRDERSNRGWRAVHYNQLQPALSLAAEIEAESCWFFSLFSPPPCSVAFANSLLAVSAGDVEATVEISTAGASLVHAISVSGAAEDRLELD